MKHWYSDDLNYPEKKLNITWNLNRVFPNWLDFRQKMMKTNPALTYNRINMMLSICFTNKILGPNFAKQLAPY